MQENKTFPENLELLVQEFEANSRITGHFEDRTEPSFQLPYQNAVTLFHICQEALSNVARHADATRAEVQLWKEDSRAYLEVSDDGKGFNLDTTKTSLGHGLSNMQRRTRKVGGNLTIHSAPLQGTTVEAWVPTEE
jgi:signal transduction histidine kinase